MSKPRTCPYCRAVLGITDGFTFDSLLNLMCGNCGKVVFPSSDQTQKGVPKLPPKLTEADFGDILPMDRT